VKLFREGVELPDATTLADCKVENGEMLAMTYALPEGVFSLLSGACILFTLLLQCYIPFRYQDLCVCPPLRGRSFFLAARISALLTLKSYTTPSC
jgi:hypothetical protein